MLIKKIIYSENKKCINTNMDPKYHVSLPFFFIYLNNFLMDKLNKA